MAEDTEKQDNINLGDSLKLSALQLTLLCDRAIERFLDALSKYNEEDENGMCILRDPPETMEAARDEVVALFRENSKDVIKAAV